MYRDVPPQVDLPALEHDVLALWQGPEHLPPQPRAARRRADVGLLRGAPHGQRHPGHPPHRGSRLQGRLPPVPDDEGVPGSPQGRLGLPRAPGRDRRREGAGLLRQAGHRGVRRRGVQRQVPRVGAAPRRRVRADDRADGLLGRHRPGLLDDGPGVRRQPLVGPASRSTTRDCSSRTTGWLPTVPAAAPVCPTTSWPRATRRSSTRRCTCASRSTGGPLAGREAALLVWTTTPWTLVSNTAVAVHPDVDYVARAHRRPVSCSSSPSRCWPTALGDDADGREPPLRAPSWSARAIARPSTWSTIPDEGPIHTVLAGRLRHRHRRHRAGAPGTGLRPRRPRRRARPMASRSSTRCCPPASSAPTSTSSAASSSRRPTTTLVADLGERGLLFAHLPYEHSYPHCWRCHTPLMYYAQPSWYIRTTAIKDELLGAERGDHLVPGVDQARPVRQLAGEQHRLGAVAQPLLGHAAADLALRRRST